ncbi:lysine decarboxylase [Paenibacillus sp. J31TS4]|uniref:aminotransferase class I/II-fold pyridoxal phosphate-dependent enzyme n=1 Tax=Paenibacillus sp. J31TS4 TaxID=2807195 RepID=UPI001B138619|nr:aminotransferase class I/II-fold pyridoxal phosphate-dependent enzyme [Paenibacillus sp. J31TS4]GIP41384.1 lysine decarboxylase [Paenibacillus sp. J31TS4]
MNEPITAAAPLYRALAGHIRRRPASFHVPGHKGGEALPDEAVGLLKQVMTLDLTEVTGLDDLHRPEGPILEAQRLAASCFGAEESWLLVNGSTVGNLAMVLGVCGRGERLIVQRNVHKSVLHGLMLAGAEAVFVPPVVDVRTGLAGGVDPEAVADALERHPEARGVLLTNPNYYGMGISLGAIADEVHAKGLPLLVDEAHGAHYGMHPALPESALAQGADVVVQSTHKLLTALTMGAMLHVQGPRVDRRRLAQCLAMLQSSSPSYPILASLDLARALVQQTGSALFEEGLAAAREVRQAIGGMSQFAIPEWTAPTAGWESQDPFKLAVRDRTGTLTGFALQRELEEDGCMVEMADEQYALLVFSLASRGAEAERLVRSLERIRANFSLAEKEKRDKPTNNNSMPPFPLLSEPVPFEFDRRTSRQTVSVPIQQAAGRRSAEMVIPYPPGIPVLYPGERISTEAVRQLDGLRIAGARFQGTADPALLTLQVEAD